MGSQKKPAALQLTEISLKLSEHGGYSIHATERLTDGSYEGGVVVDPTLRPLDEALKAAADWAHTNDYI